jgi:hypothetical protein
MPAASTMTPIFTQALTANASSITFNSIPQTYTDLMLVIHAYSTSTGNDNVGLIFNGDTATNYSWCRIFGNGSVASSRTSNASQIGQGTFNVGSSYYSPLIYNIMNYSNTTTYKNVFAKAASPADQITAIAGTWRSNSAITSLNINLYASGANYGTGSTFTLYGIKAA